MATPNDYIERAASYIGVSGTDNIFNTWIWGRHVYDPNQYPWCAAFQSYVGIHDLNMPFSASASAAGVAWQGQQVDFGSAEGGDWVLFNWDGRSDFGWADHIGLVEWVDHSSGYFGTIEGNTGGGEGSVMRCTRGIYNGYSTMFFRPPYDGQGGGYGESEEEMACIFQPNGESYLVYYDGHEFHKLTHPDEVTAINMVYQGCFGKDIPMFALGEPGAPWATRFYEAASRGW